MAISDSNSLDIDLLLQKLEAERAKLQEAENTTEALIASIGEGVIVTDEYGDITRINDVALEMLGYEREELCGQWLPKAVPSQDKDGRPVPTTERPAVRALLTGKPVTSVVSYARKDGTAIPMASTAAPLLLNDQPKGVVIVFRDLTREIQIEKTKDEFISLTSHQLSTPLTAVQLFTQLIKDSENLSGLQRDYLSKIEISVDRMLQLVHDFLNVSRLELGALLPNYEYININDLIKQSIKEVKPAANERGVRVVFKQSTLVNVPTDHSLLSQAIHNLLTNAIKYCPENEGIVLIRVYEHDGKPTISVSDNGIGIPDDAKAKIYERLFRADNAAEIESSGTGLGLYLVKKIIECMDGKTWFESKLNEGTTFYVQLPKDIENVSKFTAKKVRTK
jgi:two-component system phosphate regulon sensor histidine kinase PhoR